MPCHSKIRQCYRFHRQLPAGVNFLKRFLSSGSAQEEIQETQLHHFHRKHGGKMVPFAGWSMPVQYNGLSIIESHHHTRKSASLFDVSHMLQFKIHGKDRVKTIEQLVVGDIEKLTEGTGTLSLFTNGKGGIHDDCIINNAGDHLYVVSNAGCADKIESIMKDHIWKVKNHSDVALEFLGDMSLIALQGPKASETLQQHVSIDLSSLKFMNGRGADICGVSGCRVTRCGYTGEDGFELSIPSNKVEDVAEILFSEPAVELAGLGARDTLRLEAGLCLYGNDIDETTTPLEASLLWTIGKRRRTTADFPGADIILKQIKEKSVTRKRVGLISPEAPARAHAPMVGPDGNVIGVVTSGCPSPSLQKNIAMAYVKPEFAKVGTSLSLKRGKRQIPAIVTKMPFNPTNYCN